MTRQRTLGRLNYDDINHETEILTSNKATKQADAMRIQAEQLSY